MKKHALFFNAPLYLLIWLLLPAANVVQAQSLSVYAVFSDSARAAAYLEGRFYFSNIDTTATSQIEVKVGSSEIDTMAVFSVIDYDNPSSLPSGFSYERTGSHLELGVTSAISLLTYYCEVRIKSGGTWSVPYRFITN